MKTSCRFSPSLFFVLLAATLFTVQTVKAQPAGIDPGYLAELQPTYDKWDVKANICNVAVASKCLGTKALSMVVCIDAASSEVNFQLEGLADSEAEIKVFGHTGEDVFQQKIMAGTQYFCLDPTKEKIPTGEYFVTLKAGEVRLTQMVFISE